MPAVVNSSVGSLGTSGDDGTTVCPFFSKNPRNARRSSAATVGLGGVWEGVIRAPVRIRAPGPTTGGTRACSGCEGGQDSRSARGGESAGRGGCSAVLV